ncbi:hypothetical protein, partial [Streptomyces sp. NPDC058317]|uniref:hypothetical protein n=1 Tax=Streptomyces sp. NPDC058317 TaxID=3346443 RepID=UPI0036F07F46
VDGVWGTIKGLGTLVGFGGWEAMGQAWKGLAQLATGLVLTSLPGLGTLFWALPDDKLPSWIRDSRTAMKETGKALVAWDEWGKNPARAAGAVTFNVLTTVFTGGAGGAASGAGKAGAVAKALSVAGKAGRVIDPMTYVAKGAGAGLSKIGDITKALKGIGKIDIPALPENAITLPKDAFRLPDGSFHLPEGTPIPEGATKLPNGTFKLPDDVPVVHDGAHPLPTPEDTGPLYGHPDGHIVDGNGKILIHADELHKPPATETNLPHTPDPTREPALVGTAPHTATETAAHTGADAGGHEAARSGGHGDVSDTPHSLVRETQVGQTHEAPHEAGREATPHHETGGSSHAHSGSGRDGAGHHAGGHDNLGSPRDHASGEHGHHETHTASADGGHHPAGDGLPNDDMAHHVDDQDVQHADASNDGPGLENRGTPTPTPQTHPLGKNRDGFSIMRSDDPFYREALKSKPLPGHYDVVAHGTPHNTLMDTAGGRELTPRQMADIVRRRSDYTPGTPVRLLSCNTGHVDGSFAAQLARNLDAPVIAPDGFLYADQWGRFGVHRDRMLFVNNVPGLPNTFYRYHPGGYVEEIPRSEWAVD